MRRPGASPEGQKLGWVIRPRLCCLAWSFLGRTWMHAGLSLEVFSLGKGHSVNESDHPHTDTFRQSQQKVRLMLRATFFSALPQQCLPLHSFRTSWLATQIAAVTWPGSTTNALPNSGSSACCKRRANHPPGTPEKPQQRPPRSSRL